MSTYWIWEFQSVWYSPKIFVYVLLRQLCEFLVNGTIILTITKPLESQNWDELMASVKLHFFSDFSPLYEYSLSEFEMINFKRVINRYHRWWRHGAHRIPARDEISHGSSRAPQMCHLYGWTSMWGPQKCPILRMENFNGGHIGIQYYVFFCLPSTSPSLPHTSFEVKLTPNKMNTPFFLLFYRF